MTSNLDVSKNRGKTPKMDGEKNGNPYEQMDDLGGFPIIFGSTPIWGINPGHFEEAGR